MLAYDWSKIVQKFNIIVTYFCQRATEFRRNLVNLFFNIQPYSYNKLFQLVGFSLKQKDVPVNFANFPGKHLCWSFFLIKLQAFMKKRVQHRCFPVSFTTVLRTPILKNIANNYFWEVWFFDWMKPWKMRLFHFHWKVRVKRQHSECLQENLV